ncbi:hypothetical protein E5D53_33370 [Pseudomonas aeruginosa]|nr:hypothetical protein E5D53_33370 [Pseudomonas aeruginosa]
MAGLQQLNWASEGVGATAAALVDLSTVAGNKISNPPWVKFQSAGWVNFPSAPTRVGVFTQPELPGFFHCCVPDRSEVGLNDPQIPREALRPLADLLFHLSLTLRRDEAHGRKQSLRRVEHEFLGQLFPILLSLFTRLEKIVMDRLVVESGIYE